MLPRVCPGSTGVLQDIPASPTSAAPARTASPSSYLCSAASSCHPCHTPTGGGQPRAAAGPTWGCLGGAQPSGCSCIVRRSRAEGRLSLPLRGHCPAAGCAGLAAAHRHLNGKTAVGEEEPRSFRELLSCAQPSGRRLLGGILFFFFFFFHFLSVSVIHFSEVTWRKAGHRPLPTEAKVGTMLPPNAPGFRQQSQPVLGRSSSLLHPAPRARPYEGHFPPLQVMSGHSAHARGTAPSLGLGIAAGPAMGRAEMCRVPV